MIALSLRALCQRDDGREPTATLPDAIVLAKRSASMASPLTEPHHRARAGVRWHIVMAGNVLLSAPALAVIAFAQKHLLRAVTSRAR